MMRYFILYSLMLIATANIHSQNDICSCHLDYFKADKFYFAKNLDSSLFYYKKAFTNVKFKEVAKLYNAASKLIFLGEQTYAEELLFDVRKKGVTISDIQDFVKMHSKYKFSIDSVALGKIAVDSFKIDKFLLQELKFMHDRDQMMRTVYEDAYSDAYKKQVDVGNFQMLKNILERYGGLFPAYEEVGDEGAEYISTILIHSDLQWIVEIFPALVDAIRKGYMFNETLIYQIDRNIVDSGQTYIYDDKLRQLVIGPPTSPILDSKLYHQFYGGFDINDTKNNRSVWWPFQPNSDKAVVNRLRNILCLDSLEDYFMRKPYVKIISEKEFLGLMNH